MSSEEIEIISIIRNAKDPEKVIKKANLIINYLLKNSEADPEIIYAYLQEVS